MIISYSLLALLDLGLGIFYLTNGKIVNGIIWLICAALYVGCAIAWAINR